MKDNIARKLKEEIEKKRNELNTIVIEEIDKSEILRISQELDVLISEYTYQTEEGIQKNR